MTGCKRCALKGGKGKEGKGKRREKIRKKEEKMGIKIVFFFLFFFISPRAGFSYAQWSFFKYITGDDNIHKSLDVSEIQPDPTTDHRVSCTSASKINVATFSW